MNKFELIYLEALSVQDQGLLEVNDKHIQHYSKEIQLNK
jgi:hypothetical protein